MMPRCEITNANGTSLHHSAKSPYPTPPSSDTASIDTGPSCFESRFFPGKGYGLVATTAVIQGQEICREKPFACFDLPVKTDQVGKAVAALSDEKRILFWSFRASIPDIKDVATNVVETNSISLFNPDDDDYTDSETDFPRSGDAPATALDLTQEDGECGMFENISLVSHSCRPNAAWSWDGARGQLVLIAHANIPEGTEITATYRSEDQLLPRKHTQLSLWNRFGFHCLCDSCSLSPQQTAVSDQRLSHLRRLEKRFCSADSDPFHFAWDRGKALNELDQAMRLAAEEGLETLLLEHWERRFEVEAMWGLKSKAVKAARERLNLSQLLRGDWRIPEELRVWCTRPDTFWGWNEARQWNGGKIVSNVQVLRLMAQSTSDDGDSDFECHWTSKAKKRRRR